VRTAAALLALVLAATLAACGSDAKSDLRALDGDVQQLGVQVGDAITGAGSKANQALATRFGELSTKARDLANKLDDVDASGDVKPARDRLSQALRRAARDLQSLSTAATNGDGAAARGAAVRIVQDGEQVESARTALASAVRT
jgi:hypothetical protein